MRLAGLPAKRRAPSVCVVISLFVVWIAASSLRPIEGEDEGLVRVATADAPNSGPTDDDLRKKVLGRWRNDYHGVRFVVNRPDGTASMDLSFDFLGALFYGSTMKLELKWAIEKGVMTYEIQSGVPEATSKKMVADFGAAASYHFKEADEDTMHLVRVGDPGEQYVWKRVD